MALTHTLKNQNATPESFGSSYAVFFTTLFDNSYPTGGESITPADLLFPSGYKFVWFTMQPSAGYVFEYDYTNQKVKVYVPGIAFGAAGALTLDDFPLTAAAGRTATSVGLASTATSPVRFGALQEVENTADLSAVTARGFAVAAVVA